MTIIRNETLADAPARERLLDIAFGDCRYSKTSERLREGRLPSEGLSFVACREGRVIDALTGVRGLISATGRLQPGRDVAAPLPVHLTGSVGTATPLAA
jgi:hypothetical protein